ncbi:MAG: transposase [Candidatus Marinimicrobia bacterium]|jgi:hypothetical protein|nr:transposase [Candidatus Scalindua sp.]MBT6304133.1 transposase [Candidatus Neomarinimicrobiota bacterium]
MPEKRNKAEQIIHTLRAIEVELSKGNKLVDICRKLGFKQYAYYRWRKRYGGMKIEQAKRFNLEELFCIDIVR